MIMVIAMLYQTFFYMLISLGLEAFVMFFKDFLHTIKRENMEVNETWKRFIEDWKLFIEDIQRTYKDEYGFSPRVLKLRDQIMKEPDNQTIIFIQ